MNEMDDIGCGLLQIVRAMKSLGADRLVLTPQDADETAKAIAVVERDPERIKQLQQLMAEWDRQDDEA
jgi:hypothetical protein